MKGNSTVPSLSFVEAGDKNGMGINYSFISLYNVIRQEEHTE